MPVKSIYLSDQDNAAYVTGIEDHITPQEKIDTAHVINVFY